MVRKLDTWDADNHQNIKLLLKIGDSGVEEIMSYVEVCDYIEAMIEAEEKGDTSIFTFKNILDHEGSLTSRSENYKAVCSIFMFNGRMALKLGNP